MTRRRSDPLRALADTERTELLHLSRSWSAPAGQVARANALLAVADGHSYTAAAHMAGRHQGDTIARSRFNHEGLAAMVPRHGGGPRVRYGDDQRRRILAEVARAPDRERDGTATWSLTTLRAALRRADDGLPAVSTFTLWRTLRDAGLSWQQDRTWCFTGVAVRRRKQDGVITVTDPDAAAKKLDRAGLHPRPAFGRLVRRRSRSLSNPSASRLPLGAGTPAGSPSP